MLRIWFRCLFKTWNGNSWFLFSLVTGERIKVNVMKISFKHGWFSHRARSSIFWIHLVIFTIASAVAELQFGTEISDYQFFLINFWSDQFLPKLFFQILSGYSNQVYVRAVGLAAVLAALWQWSKALHEKRGKIQKHH